MWGKKQMNHWYTNVNRYKKKEIYILHPMDDFVERKKCVYFRELYFEFRMI